MSRKYVQQLNAIKAEKFKELMIQAAYNIRRNDVDQIIIKNWRNPLFLNQIPNFDSRTTVGKLLGKHNTTISLIAAAFDLKSIKVFTKGDQGSELVFLLFNRIPGNQHWLNVQAAKIFIYEIIANKKSYVDLDSLEQNRKRIHDHLNKLILSYGQNYLKRYLKYDQVDDELAMKVGNLVFCSSYDQNILEHSDEMGQMAAYIAEKLGLNPLTAKRSAFFHDIGKAIGEPIDHVKHGLEIAKKFDLDEEIYRTIRFSHSHKKLHHNEILDYAYPIISRALDKFSAFNNRIEETEFWNNIRKFIQDRIQQIQWIKSFHISVGECLLDIHVDPNSPKFRNKQNARRPIIQILDELGIQKDFVRKFQINFYYRLPRNKKHLLVLDSFQYEFQSSKKTNKNYS
ncbi:HDIG domain-containing metalloprotein [Mycoplasmoides fastidiosum]|uniref:HDIG domain-containing metalloprotein n=1 Tax=Mycoplasmoides fastidiosum TaxID=92758 RepID=UPI002113A283|nr:HDIG domain-containing metalloprotein [Mycoplasmoides fastidiosum]UUD37405.1 HDIG domain-containing protein [Mycoplasmoides fastidiosum]